MINKQVEKFLDYEIVNTGNGDGWVITKPNGKLYECNLGNYGKVEDAKRDCIRYFMVARPEKFASWVVARMRGHQLYMDYYKFVMVLHDEGFSVPDGISASDDGNYLLDFWGDRV